MKDDSPSRSSKADNFFDKHILHIWFAFCGALILFTIGMTVGYHTAEKGMCEETVAAVYELATASDDQTPIIMQKVFDADAKCRN